MHYFHSQYCYDNVNFGALKSLVDASEKWCFCLYITISIKVNYEKLEHCRPEIAFMCFLRCHCIKIAENLFLLDRYDLRKSCLAWFVKIYFLSCSTVL